MSGGTAPAIDPVGMPNEDTTTSKISAADLERVLSAPAEPSATDVTKPTPRRRACTIDREDMVTSERVAMKGPRGRQRRRRMMFPALAIGVSGGVEFAAPNDTALAVDLADTGRAVDAEPVDDSLASDLG